jgi:hypothetical protein
MNYLDSIARVQFSLIPIKPSDDSPVQFNRYSLDWKIELSDEL